MMEKLTIIGLCALITLIERSIMNKLKKKVPNKIAALGLILISFVVIILIGSVLLVCPFSHGEQGLSFVDALFTSFSAVCVTGLSPVADISASLNIFGRIVLTILIEIGGLGFVSIVMFIAILLGYKFSFGQRMLLKEALNQDAMGGIVLLLKRIVVTAFIIQFVGVTMNFIDFFFIHNLAFGESLGYGIFHAVSSFNNAGFDIFGYRFGNISMIGDALSNDLLLNISTSLMIIAGGIGFIVIFDILHCKKLKKLSMHSKIVLSTTFVLLVGGTILFKVLNWDTLTWLQAFFMSVTSRTAGFSTVDISTLNDTSIILTEILMFFGAAPGSTGGGVKVTTLFTMFVAFKSFATGKAESHAFNRKVPSDQVNKAFILVGFAFFFILINAMIVMEFEQFNPNVVDVLSFKQILFEVISAFGTVGLSLGITPQLTVGSKLFLCIVMFVGRLGPITFISLFNHNASKTKKDSIGYVEGNVIIG